MKSASTCGLKHSKSVKTTTRGWGSSSASQCWLVYQSASAEKVHWADRLWVSSSISSSSSSSSGSNDSACTDYVCHTFYKRPYWFLLLFVVRLQFKISWDRKILTVLLARFWHWWRMWPTKLRTLGQLRADSSATCGDTCSCSSRSRDEYKIEWSGKFIPVIKFQLNFKIVINISAW